MRSLSEEELERYSRQLVLGCIGFKGQRRLKAARVCVIGLGGLGSYVSIQLASMGVGFMRLVDRDVVEPSNLHRQPLYSPSSVGMPKAEEAAKILSRLNPSVELEPLTTPLNQYTAEELVKGCNVVVDGLDSVEARYAVNRACVKLNIPYIYGAAVSTYGAVKTILPYETACLECFMPGLRDELLPSCAVVGVHPSLVSLVASVEASEAVRLMVGARPGLLETLLHIDLSDLSFDHIRLKRDLGCPVCGEGSRREPTPIPFKPVSEVCARHRGKRSFTVNPKAHMKLDVEGLVKAAERLGGSVKSKGRLGATITLGDVEVSVVDSGAAVVVGVGDEDEAKETYERLMKELGVKPQLG